MVLLILVPHFDIHTYIGAFNSPMLFSGSWCVNSKTRLPGGTIAKSHHLRKTMFIHWKSVYSDAAGHEICLVKYEAQISVIWGAFEDTYPWSYLQLQGPAQNPSLQKLTKTELYRFCNASPVSEVSILSAILCYKTISFARVLSWYIIHPHGSTCIPYLHTITLLNSLFGTWYLFLPCTPFNLVYTNESSPELCMNTLNVFHDMVNVKFFVMN